MDGMAMGTPWLDKPITLHAYREFECQFNDTALCEYEQGYWRFWYEADHRYALPTVGFFLCAIFLFAMAHLFTVLAPDSLKSLSLVRRSTALARLLSYRVYRFHRIDWNTAPLGVLLLGAIGIIFFACMILAPKPYYWPDTAEFGSSPPIATRSGWLSLACLPFAFATAGKSNAITAVTGVSHEKLQVYHRWISYAFFVTALVHTFPFIVYNVQTGMMVMSWNTLVFYWTGVVALIAQAYLTFASISPLRSMSYEWFKFSHFLAALIFVLFLFFHCDHTLSAWDYFIATGVLFALSWLHRQYQVYFKHGINPRANLEMTANGFIRVRIPTTATWTPGQHFFVRFLSLGLHMGSIHPFTACSLPSVTGKPSELVLYIRPRGGLTARLAHVAASQPNRAIRVLLDGPYGGVHSTKVTTSQRQLIIAGGSGAGWLLPMITSFLRERQQVSQRGSADPFPHSARVVLVTRDATTRAWFEETIAELLTTFDLTKVPERLEIELYYTAGVGQVASGPPKQSASDPWMVEKDAVFESTSVPERSDSDLSADLFRSRNIRYFTARPKLPAMIRDECTPLDSRAQLGVFLCGPLAMQHDVSNAVADQQLETWRSKGPEMYLHMEHFSWA